MRFWDTSAIVALLTDEPSSAAVLGELERDPQLVAWWGTEIECVSAVSRRERDGALDAQSMVGAIDRLNALSRVWTEVVPGQRVRQVAVRLLRVHQLRATDALQLAAAIVASEDQPASLPLVTLDKRLAKAAEREGFTVIRPDRAG